MPPPMTCPHCGTNYPPHEALAGKVVRCARCSKNFTAPAAESREPEIDFSLDEHGNAPAAAVSERPMPASAPPPTRPRPPRHDDTDDRSRRRPAAGVRGNGTILLVVSGVCLAIFLVCGGLIGLVGWKMYHAAAEARRQVEQARQDFERNRREIEQAQQKALLDLNNVKKDGGIAPGPLPGAAVRLTLGPDGVGRDNNVLMDRDKLDFPKPSRLYMVRLEQGRTYQIDLETVDFDAYLYLISPGGQILTHDDDGGNRLNSRIRWTAQQTGEYTIRATCLFTLSREPAAYLLTVQRN